MSDLRSQAKDIVVRALEIHASDARKAFIDQSCGEDEQLHAAVAALLESLHGQSAINLDSKVRRTIDVDPGPLESGLAATFVSDAAVVIGDAGHSVLKSLGRTLTRIPQVNLRDADDGAARPWPSAVGGDIDERYELHGEIARGGMGAIIKGRDNDLGRDLAIKVLLDSHKDSPDVVARFVEEAQIGGQLEHPGIVPVHELGQFADQRPFFSMKLVKGQTLASLLQTRTDPNEDLPKFLGIFEQICQTMAYAHSRGVIHRDLKPANVMVGAFGEVQVMDWGLAKVLEGGVSADAASHQREETELVQTSRSGDSDVSVSSGSQTRMGSVMGTLAYMPPEQARGEINRVDERADVFGLGAILCEILTSKPPYEAAQGEALLDKAIGGQLDNCLARLDKSGVEPELISLAKQALVADPESRIRNAGIVADRMAGYLSGVQERLKQAELTTAKAQARRKLYVAIAGLMVVVAVGSLIAAGQFRQLAKRESKARNETETQLRIATVMRLAAQSQSTQKEFPIQSLLLAKEAAEFSQQELGRVLPVAHETLLSTVAGIGGKPIFAHGLVSSGGISPDGRWLVTGGGTLVNTARLWDLNAQEPASSARMLQGHEDAIWSVKFSPDGRWLLTGSYDNTSRLWDLSAEDPASSSVVLPGGYPGTVSGDGRWVITGSGSDGTVRLFDLTADATDAAPLELPGRGPANGVDTSTNGRWLVVDSGTGVTRLWDLHAGDLTSPQRTWLETGKVSADGRWLVTGGREHTPRLWDLDHNDPTSSPRVLNGLEGVVPAVISRDGRWLVEDKGWQQTVHVWDLAADDLASGQTVLRGHEDAVSIRATSFSPDSRWVATGAYDSTVRLWNLTAEDPNRASIVLRGHEGGIHVMAFTPDGGLLATAGEDGTARLWDLTGENPATAFVLTGYEGRIVQEFPVGGMIASRDARWVAGPSRDNVARLWDLKQPHPKSPHVLRGHESMVNSVAIGPRGHWLVTATDSTVRLWDMTASDPAASPRVLTGFGGRSVAISPDGRWLAAGFRHAAVWDLHAQDVNSTARVVEGHEDVPNVLISRQSTKKHTHVIETVSFSPDSRWLVTGGLDKTVRLCDVTAAEPEKSCRVLEHGCRVGSVAFSPNGRWLATAAGAWGWQDFDRRGRLWDLSAGAPRPSYQILPVEPHSVLIGPKGRWLAAACRDTTIRLWDLGSPAIEESEIVLTGHQGRPHALAFSLDGRWLVSGSHDRTAHLWDLVAKDPSASPVVFRGHEGIVESVAITPDNRWIVTASNDGTVRLWDRNVGSLLERARHLAGREFTEEEKKLYGVQ